jgi:hypothetical protein
MLTISVEFGKDCKIMNFIGKTVYARKADGSLVSTAIIPHVTTLYEYVEKVDWDASVRLCRFIKVHIPSVILTLSGSTNVELLGCHGSGHERHENCGDRLCCH